MLRSEELQVLENVTYPKKTAKLLPRKLNARNFSRTIFSHRHRIPTSRWWPLLKVCSVLLSFFLIITCYQERVTRLSSSMDSGWSSLTLKTTFWLWVWSNMVKGGSLSKNTCCQSRVLNNCRYAAKICCQPVLQRTLSSTTVETKCCGNCQLKSKCLQVKLRVIP